jgi:GNAT superfamily N-acetyltransferase
MGQARAVIRSATPADVPAILALIRDLAEYERAIDEVRAAPEQLHDALFGPQPAVFCDVADEDGQIVGFALWFLSFSTWLGRHGIYLEDLYVRPDRRGAGIGRELLAGLARRCVECGYGRLEWSVLDWNEPALGFYRALGAEAMDEWTVHRVTGEALARLGTGAGTG